LLKKKTLISVTLVFAFFALLMFPVNAQYTSQTNSVWYNTFDRFGPHIDQVTIVCYETEDAMWLALEAGDIDMTDWEASPTFIEKWSVSPYTEDIELAWFNDLGQREIDLNHYWYTPTYPNWPNPTAYQEFRQALAHLVDKDRIITDILQGYGGKMESCVPSWLTAWYNPDAPTYAYNPATALQILTDAGWVDGSTIVYPALDPNGEDPHPKAGEPLDGVILYARTDDPLRLEAGVLLKEEMEGIGIPTDFRPEDSSVTFPRVMQECDFHIYTGGWSLTRWGDHLWDIYGSEQFYYWEVDGEETTIPDPTIPDPHPCVLGPYLPWSGPNYGRFRNPTYDYWARPTRYAETLEEALEGGMEAQILFQEYVVTIPLWYSMAPNPVRIWSDRAPEGWQAFVASPYTVSGHDFTFADVRRSDQELGGELNWGFKLTPIKITPMGSSWYYEWNVLARIYGSMISVNPTTLSDIYPKSAGGTGWGAWDFVSGTWVDPEDGETKSKCTYYLRQDINWHDGTPATAEDVVFTIEYVKGPYGKYADLGHAVGWEFSAVEDVKTVYMIDLYTVEVLYDVLSWQSAYWVGQMTVLPKHIWETVTDPGVEVVERLEVGCGPFKFISFDRVAGVIILEKNDDFVGARSPINAFVAGPARALPDTTNTYNIVIDNKWAPQVKEGEIVVEGYDPDRTYTGTVSVYVDDVLHDTIEVTDLAAGDHIQVPYDLAFTAGLHTIRIETTPDAYTDLSRTYTHQIWVTMPVDVNRDFKVDIVDIFTVAKAFGTTMGHIRWDAIADISGDYKVNIQDIFLIAKNFGWSA